MNLAAAYRPHPKHAPGKIRFREAYQQWSNVTGGSREQFADALGVNFSEVKRGLSLSDDRPIRGDLIRAAEALAAQQRSPISDAELGAAVRRLVTLIFATQEHAA